MPAHATAQPALVLFCRRPAPGIGKQRIAAASTPAFAAGLGERLLATALEDLSAWPGPIVIAPAEPADLPWAREQAPERATAIAQPGGNLGERLEGVDRTLRSAGHTAILYIGSDAPLLDFAFHARARRALEMADVVLAAAEDGGVTLMGSRLPWPPLADLPWSTTRLGDSLDRHCRAHGLSVGRLDGGYDCDTLEALPRLVADLGGDTRPARRALLAWLTAEGIAPA